MKPPTPLLDVRRLTVAYEQDGALLPAVRDFSLQLAAGQTHGLVGESGSGKTTVALAVMRYLGAGGRILGGSIHFDGHEILALDEAQLRRLWGKEIALVPQNPQSALNPSMRIGEQIAEILRRHMEMDRRQALRRSAELLEMVRVPDPQRVLRSYAHQISGGMQQRVLIAMALSTEPKLLILDEPTTGLDVTTQAAILDLFRALTRARQTAVLYVTHNLGVVATLCDRVTVLYAGEQIEDAPVADLFQRPYHPYTEGLLDSVPQIGQTKADVTLKAIPGQIPPLDERDTEGCIFAPRCALVIDACRRRPDLEDAAGGRAVRCFRWPEIAQGLLTTHRPPAAAGEANGPGDSGAGIRARESMLAGQGIKVYFEMGRSLGDFLRRRPGPLVKAVDGVDLMLDRARTLGIVGESGSGKTTLARAIVGLAARTAGEIDLFDVPLPPELDDRALDMLRQLQFVFQNPDEALNPHLTVGQSLSRPFVTLLGMSEGEAAAGVEEVLRVVRLPASFAARYPAQLSGGEKQRVAIARAFAANPDLLITDEPVSALDVSVQASILNLLQELQRENGNALLFISHDLAVVAYLADRVAVMYLGKIVELAEAGRLFSAPMHPYTEALLAAIPQLDPHHAPGAATLAGEVPSQVDTPPGCPFHPRCPRILGEICRTDVPPLRENEQGDRIVCHIPLPDLAALQAEKGPV